MNIASYVTVDDMKEIDIHTSSGNDDNILAKICLEASRDWEALCRGRLFYPVRKTKVYGNPDDSRTLMVRDDLLEVIELTVDSDVITSDKYYLAAGEDANLLPANTLRLRDTTGVVFSTTDHDGVQVDGYWGFVNNWGHGTDFIDTGVNLTGITGTTTLNVDTLSGVDILGLTAQIRRLDMIKLVEGAVTEYALVTAIDTGANELTVIRAINGTTAITFSSTIDIEVWRPDADIMHHVRRLAVFYYRQKDTSRADVERPIITNGGIVLPMGVPKDIIRASQRYHEVFL